MKTILHSSSSILKWALVCERVYIAHLMLLVTLPMITDLLVTAAGEHSKHAALSGGDESVQLSSIAIVSYVVWLCVTLTSTL